MKSVLEITRETEKNIVCFLAKADYITPHYHSNLEMHYALEDGFTIIINGIKRILKKGDFILINSNDIHSTYGINSICVLIPSSYLTEIEEFKKNNPLNQTYFYDTNGKLFDIIKRFEDENLHYLGKKAIVYDLFCELYSLNAKNNSSQSFNQNPSQQIAKNFIEYINQNYQNQITIEDAAITLNYSKYYLSHSIKKYLGCNFNQYLNMIRLKVFVSLFEANPNEELLNIIFKCGFNSISSFYRNFTKLYNCSPKKFINDIKTKK